MTRAKKKVVCIHLGSRAHYLIPMALEKEGILEFMVTESWVRNKRLREYLRLFPLRSIKSLAGRYSEDIPNYRVKSLGVNFLLKELFIRVSKKGWNATILRNRYFQEDVLKSLPNNLSNVIVYGTSYSSLEIFRYAKKKNLRTALFQIDPGKFEEDIVATLNEQGSHRSLWNKAPTQYWTDWNLECQLSDIIIVNSEWSKKALIVQGIPSEKIKVLSLPISLQQQHYSFVREYPQHFSKERPLKCLFLGTLTLRKGIHLVIEAAKRLVGYPIEFHLVGISELNLTDFDIPSVKYHGAVTREETTLFYKGTDVFLFPTFSDGFGHTQLEAMAWQLPVVASERCGEVVNDGINGWVIDLKVEDLVKILLQLLNNADLLKIASKKCLSTAKDFEVSTFSQRLADALSD